MLADYTPPKPGSKILVVGAGAFGLSTAYALALKRCYNVWVFDRNQIPVPDASSTDINKAVRLDYGDDVLSMNLMLEAFETWGQWNKERAEEGLSPVFNNTGVIHLGRNGEFSAYEQKSMHRIREAGYGDIIEELSNPEDIINRFPVFEEAVKGGYNIGYYNKRGGWCNSSEAIKHVYGKCIDSGVHFVLGAEEGSFKEVYSELPGTVSGITTQDGKVHTGDLVILATGPWTGSLIDLGDQLAATGQVVIQFKPPNTSSFRTFKDFPVWSADVSKTGFYGFPLNGEGKLKIARHATGYVNPRTADGISVPRTQVSNPSDTIPIEALRAFRDFLGKFFPETSTLDITYSRVCWYSDTTDGNFLITPHPNLRNLIIASGDSGHGMKFLPVIGSKIVEIVEGKETEYSKIWRWRESQRREKADGSRNAQQNVLAVLDDPNNGNTRMVTHEELLA